MALALVLSGCAPRVCTTVGYLHTLTIDVEAAGSGAGGSTAERLELCLEAACGVTFSGERIGAEQWLFEGLPEVPTTVWLRGASADGMRIEPVALSPTWSGDDSPCGGPAAGVASVSL